MRYLSLEVYQANAKVAERGNEENLTNAKVAERGTEENLIMDRCQNQYVD